MHESNERREGIVVSQNSVCVLCSMHVCSSIQVSRCVFRDCVTQGILCLSFQFPTNEGKLLTQHGQHKTWNMRGGQKNNKEDGLLIIPLFLINPIIHTSGIKVVGRIFQKALLQYITEAQSVSEYVLYIVMLQWLQKQLLWSWNVKESQQGNHCLLKAVSA